MLQFRHGCCWLVVSLLLEASLVQAAHLLQKPGSEKVRDSGGGPLQFQADSGGYRNNSDPKPLQDEEVPEDTVVTENVVAFTEAEIPLTDKQDQSLVETSTHQEEMTFGEEFEMSEKIRPTTALEEENTERTTGEERPSGSTVYEVIAVDDNRDENSSDQVDFPRDMGIGESSHDGYNEDAVLYFESKRYKGLKKKTHGTAKFRDTGNSITERSRPNKERVRISSFVADISEVDGNDEKSDDKEFTIGPRDATTISTFFIAPKETHTRRTPVRIRKKIIKPVRLGYRKKQNQQHVSDSPPVFRQKVILVEPPSRHSKTNTEKEVSVTTEAFGHNVNDYNVDVVDHINLPSDDKNYLPVRQVEDANRDSRPYNPPSQHPQEVQFPQVHMVQTNPEQFLREEVPKFQNNEPSVDHTAPGIAVDDSIDPVKHTENDGTPISFMDVLSQTLSNEFRPADKQVHFVTSKKQKELREYGEANIDSYDSLNDEYNRALSSENKEKLEKPNFEETNRAEDGLTSSDTILAPIQAAVSLSNHVQQEGKKRPLPHTMIEQQEIRVEPVMKTTIEIQKSIPFEIKEIKPEYNHISNINLEYEKPVERPPSPPTDFLQQVALAYHKLSNNGDYQNNLHFPNSQHQPQNYVYFYRNRLPNIPLYFLPPNNKGLNDFNKGNVGPYIMQQSYKNLGLENPRPPQYQSLKYQGTFPSITRPLTYNNGYDLNTPILYQPNVPLGQAPFTFHKGQQHNRLPQNAEQNPSQHLGGARGAFEDTAIIGNDEETDTPSTEDSIETTEEIKQGSELQIQEIKQEVQEHPTEPPLSLFSHPPPQIQHVVEPQRILNNQPYPYGYSFIYPISTTEFRSPGPYFNYHRRGKAPPFRPSHPMYTSQYPPNTYIVASSLPDRGIHARSINNKKLCIEYGGFKPPLVPSIQIDDEFEKEAQDKSSIDEQIS